jgi:hypothetical protein
MAGYFPESDDFVDHFLTTHASHAAPKRLQYWQQLCNECVNQSEATARLVRTKFCP